jgi:hypothetical protein
MVHHPSRPPRSSASCCAVCANWYCVSEIRACWMRVGCANSDTASELLLRSTMTRYFAVSADRLGGHSGVVQARLSGVVPVYPGARIAGSKRRRQGPGDPGRGDRQPQRRLGRPAARNLVACSTSTDELHERAYAPFALPASRSVPVRLAPCRLPPSWGRLGPPLVQRHLHDYSRLDVGGRRFGGGACRHHRRPMTDAVRGVGCRGTPSQAGPCPAPGPRRQPDRWPAPRGCPGR